MSKEDQELFDLIYKALNGSDDAKWQIVWNFNDLIINASTINMQPNVECQEYVENKVFKSIEKFKKLDEIRNRKKFKKN